MAGHEEIVKKLVDELFKDDENVFFEPYRDGINYGVRRSFEEEISEKFGINREEIQTYIQQILDATVQVLGYVIEGNENKIEGLGELDKYIYEKLPKRIKDYVLSRHVLKRSMAGPVYYSIEITPILKGIPANKTSVKTFVIRLKVDKEGTLFKDDENPEPTLETITFEATEYDLQEIIEQIKGVVEDDES